MRQNVIDVVILVLVLQNLQLVNLQNATGISQSTKFQERSSSITTRAFSAFTNQARPPKAEVQLNGESWESKEIPPGILHEQLRFCWPPLRDAANGKYRVSILRKSDDGTVINSEPADSILLSTWTNGSCCCYGMSTQDTYLKPFSQYKFVYRAENSERDSVGAEFSVGGQVAPQPGVRLVRLDRTGISADFEYAVRAVSGESPVWHTLTISTRRPGREWKKAMELPVANTDLSQSWRVNRSLDSLTPNVVYELKAEVVNPFGTSEDTWTTFRTLPRPLDLMRGLRVALTDSTSASISFEQEPASILLDDLKVMVSVAYTSARMTPSIGCSVAIVQMSCQQRPKELCGCIKYPQSRGSTITVPNLKINTEYDFYVRRYYEKDELLDLPQLWPSIFIGASDWSDAISIMTESEAIRQSPILKNLSSTLLPSDGTTQERLVEIYFEYSILPTRADVVNGLLLECGNWTHQLSFSEPITTRITAAQNFVINSADISAMSNNGSTSCLFSICPTTLSRVNNAVNYRGPCSKEHIYLSFAKKAPKEASIIPDHSSVSFIITVVFGSLSVLLIGAVAILYILKRDKVLWVLKNRRRNKDQQVNNRRQKEGDMQNYAADGMELFGDWDNGAHNNVNSRGINAVPSTETKRNHPPNGITQRFGTGLLTAEAFVSKLLGFLETPLYFPAEFESILQLSAKNAKSAGWTLDEAEREGNINKNRYINVLPYDHTRVVLQRFPEDSTDYINANFITSDSPSGPRFIACQGPMPWTIPDFWQMIWERNVSDIVMLTDAVDASQQESSRKCALYWPSTVGQAMIYGNIRVLLIRLQHRSFWVERVFELSQIVSEPQEDERKSAKSKSKTTTPSHSRSTSKHYSGIDLTSRLVTHFSYLDWPDHGTPPAAIPLLRLVQRVNSGPSDRLAAVHCSAGIGRTGVFMVVMTELARLKTTGKVDPYSCLIQLRKCRPGLVQTPDQYRFIYLTLFEAIRCRAIDFADVPLSAVPVRLQDFVEREIQCKRLCEWATERVPVVPNLIGDFVGGLPDEGIESDSHFLLPGPLHSRQIGIIVNPSPDFLSRKFRQWSECGTVVFLGSASSHQSPNSAAVSPPLSPSAVFNSVSWQNSSRPLIVRLDSWPSRSTEPCTVLRNLGSSISSINSPQIVGPAGGPSLAIIIPAADRIGEAAELAVTLAASAEARLSLSSDADEPTCDVLLYARVATLTLPPGTLNSKALARTLSILLAVMQDNVGLKTASSKSSSLHLVLAPPAQPTSV